MSDQNQSGTSYALSAFLHAAMLFLFMMINLSFNYEPSEYVELSFGVSSEIGSSGSKGKQIEMIEENPKPEIKDATQDKSKEVKEVDLPVAVNTSEDNTIKPAEKDLEVSEKSSTENNKNDPSNVTSTGQGNLAEEEGSFGFDIEWGGKGVRKIYSYNLPQYPAGVKKEVDIKLQFSILPDGTIGTIIPKIKADARLENAAINSLRQWRFEALDPSQKQVEQTAVIVFPYRLQ
jgi:outer membrane biosynthesis protein TonB